MNEQYLMHHGVKGMRWGHRKAKPTTNVEKVAAKKATYDDLKKQYLSAKATNRGDDNYKSAKSAYKQAKKDYKAELNKTNENYKKNFAEKYVFNKATSERINKYLNSGATLKEARTKTYISAGVNTAAVILAAYGASRLGDKLVNKFV